VRDDVIEACLGPERVDDDVTALFVRAEAALGETVRLTLTPDPDALAALRRMLRRWLIEMGAAPDEMGGIVMAANEAWQNAIEHGHDFQPVPVNVRFERDDDEVVVTVRDAGGRGQPAGDPDRGRGIELMRGPHGRHPARPRLAPRRRGRAAPAHRRAGARRAVDRTRRRRRLGARRRRGVERRSYPL
jgi:anti-sigma regulatory factor (Ser/Thr protein kinase)